jgi:hypothetical protein
MPSIEITISPTGETKIDAVGYTGRSCADATKAIEKAIGKTASDERKAEYSQSPVKASKNVGQR